MRYFIISYMYGRGALGSGVLGIKGESYPNIHKLKERENTLNVISIMEVNEEDYNSFWQQED